MSNDIEHLALDLNIRAFCKKELIEAFLYKLDLLKHEIGMIEIGIKSNSKHTQKVAALELQRDAAFLAQVASTLAFKLDAHKSYASLSQAVSTIADLDKVQEHDLEKLPHEP